MNFNFAPIVLLVALCWMSVGIYAQTTTSTTTMAPTSNTTTNNTTVTTGSSNMTAGSTTTVSSNMTAGSTTTVSSNMTAGNATTVSSNMTAGTTTTVSSNTTAGNTTTVSSNTTAGNATTVSSTTTAGNATTGSSNMTAGNATTVSSTTTAGNATTVSSNTTAGNATTVSSNTTAGNTTSGTNTTASPATTTAPPIDPNTTVANLTANISRGQCRKEKLCAAQPNNCDPEVAGSCFFVGVKQSSGQNMDFELSGETDGYLGCTLKPTSGNETAYLCVKVNNKVIFIGARLENGKFTNETLRVNKVKAKMNGRKLQCSFSATVPNATARASATTFELSVVTGSYNESTGGLGAPETQLRTDPVDLTSPTANTNNTLTTNSTAAPTTTAGTVPLQSISNALLIILGVLSLAWL